MEYADFVKKLKAGLLESLCYALDTLALEESPNLKRVIVQDFIHSLNRKGWIPNADVESWLKEAYKLLDQKKPTEGLGALFG